MLTDPRERLEQIEAEAERLRRHIAASACRDVGCTMESYGGCNAGCDWNCNCSVPVHVCTKCGDSDYGDNAEATEVRRQCASQRAGQP